MASAVCETWGIVSSICIGSIGCGVVFEVTPTGTETVLYSFTGKADGGVPYGGLVRDSSGNLYGTTTFGGLFNSPCTNGCGVAFKVDTGAETVLYTFDNVKDDGVNPYGTLVRDSKGNL